MYEMRKKVNNNNNIQKNSRERKGKELQFERRPEHDSGIGTKAYNE